MKKFIEVNTGAILFCIILISVLFGVCVASPGSENMAYGVTDSVKGTYHMVTDKSLKLCKDKPHYSTIVVDGIERRCVKIKGE